MYLVAVFFLGEIPKGARNKNQTNQFIINTPKDSASKFWPGDLGLSGTHSVVYAQLIIDG